MSRLRDYASDARRYYLPKAATRVRDGWHHAAGRRIQGRRQQFRNWRNYRTLQRGKRDVPARLGDQVRSRTPVYRDRIDPRTGQRNRAAARTGRLHDRELGRMARTYRYERPAGRSR